MKKSLLLVFLSLLCICSMSQNKGEYSLSAFGQWGWVVPTNGFLGGNNTSNTPISQMYVASLRFVKHTSGDKYWHQLYDYPSFGVGVSGAAFNVPNQLGEPSTLYAFLSKQGNTLSLEIILWALPTIGFTLLQNTRSVRQWELRHRAILMPPLY